MKPLLTLLLAGACALTACQSESEKRAKEAEQQAQAAQEGLQQGLQQLQDLAQQSQNGSTPVQPVNFRELKELLPGSVGGMAQRNAEGQTSGTMGFTVSQAEADYGEGERSLRLSIMDFGGVPTGLMGLAAWSMATIDRETPDGYERTGVIDGYKSYEKYDNSGEQGQLSVLVGSRFIVNAESSGMSMDDLKAAVKSTNLDKLAGLGK
ncbi:MAG: transposase [Bacteroidia bacterium]|nr:transposase [Bacteroidia bacterium]